VSLKGGSTLTIQLNTPVNVDEAQEALRALTTEDLSVKEFSSAGTQLGIIVETTAQDVEFIKNFVNENYDVKTINVETIGPSLGASFFKQAIIAVIIAFALMALVIFAYFKAPTPCAYIIFSAIADILFAWAILVALNIKLSTAGVAALLMLVGYSVDTDILLTTRVLKRYGGVTEKIFGAMSTGSTMTFSALAATGIAYLVTPSEVLKQIMLILFLGLVADLWNTWLLNAGLLKMYVERKKTVKENG
ncbi:protein translocase subunit SecF, partial [Candidatus Woesearchaeota archaeon]|nr:protein translocase subunit SecF [Candidatus Woesearchaeota archaeon]